MIAIEAVEIPANPRPIKQTALDRPAESFRLDGQLHPIGARKCPDQ